MKYESLEFKRKVLRKLFSALNLHRIKYRPINNSFEGNSLHFQIASFHGTSLLRPPCLHNIGLKFIPVRLHPVRIPLQDTF